MNTRAILVVLLLVPLATSARDLPRDEFGLPLPSDVVSDPIRALVGRSDLVLEVDVGASWVVSQNRTLTTHHQLQVVTAFKGTVPSGVRAGPAGLGPTPHRVPRRGHRPPPRAHLQQRA